MVKTFRQVRRLVVIVIGFTLLLIGIAMIVLPGPAFILIPAGLALLATEFMWAKNLLQRVKETIRGEKKNNTGNS